MAEQGKQQIQQPTQTEPAPAATLDDVYRKFNVDAMVDDFAARTQPAARTEPDPDTTRQTTAEVVVPDPVTDPEGFKKFVGQDHQSRLALRQSLQQVSQQVSAFEAKQLRTQEEADIKRAVEIVNAELKADPDFVEVALGAKARKDPRFLKLYENRHKAPDAWQAALKAVTAELGDKFALRADPQLVENQRAMRTAQQAMATGTPKETRDEALGKLPMHELDRELDKVKGIL